MARIDSNVVLEDYRKHYPNGEFHCVGDAPKIVNGHDVVSALIDGSFASPKYTVVFDYKLTDGKFVLGGKPTRKQYKSGK